MAVQHDDARGGVAQPQDARATWYEEFFGALEAKDADAAAALMTPDTTLRLGNRPLVEGRDTVMAMSLQFWATIDRMEHHFDRVVEDGDTTILESRVEYTRLDGSKVTIPAMTAIQRRDGLVAAQRVYVDTAPLHSAS